MTNPIGNFLAPVNTAMTDDQRQQAIYATNIIRDIFGINGMVYFPSTTKHDVSPTGFYGIEMLPDDEVEAHSSLGTPVVGVLEFKGGEYNTYNEKGQVVKVRMNNFRLPYSCIVEFSRAAVITVTKTLGSAGSVKEIYGLDDWKINIRGIALNNAINPLSPKAHQIVGELAQWRKICDSIEVQGILFSNKEIYRIVIEDLQIQPIEGKYNVIPFQIQAISDEPVEMQIP